MEITEGKLFPLVGIHEREVQEVTDIWQWYPQRQLRCECLIYQNHVHMISGALHNL